MMALLDLLAAPTVWLLSLPPYVGMTALGLLIAAAMILWGIALAILPTGRRLSPLWVVFIFVPPLFVILLWFLAYKKWPQQI